MTARTDASRREVLKAVGIGASGAALASVLARAASPVRAEPARVDHDPADAPPAPAPGDVAAGADVQAYLGDLVGQRLGPYTVVSIGALDRGGIPVVLATPAGQAFRVDVLRLEPGVDRTGIGEASAVSVYLRNGGDGATATDEEQGLGAMALASELTRRERAGAKPPSALLTMSERQALDAARIT